MTTAGELLWDLVPPQVLATDAFTLAAMLEPCYDIGGDAYDYAINADGTLHFAVFDAMGHGLAAAGVTAFSLSVYRNSRRRDESPAATYAAIDAAIFEQYPTSRFVTGLIAELGPRLRSRDLGQRRASRAALAARRATGQAARCGAAPADGHAPRHRPPGRG
jgi:serine phosphatase RsbU (regulator of sigma subunit)